ncbi:DNA cytosine methyltransferase [Dyadobacter fermentans]|uniref:DNA cytosine methyltransferase n=1 Tax=Dyadobacter fermentans TaxID=94254 RepID=UPI001CBA75C3|nr:DNA cytosine methyltransferase [Dyadobacter fermentans]MBZ1360988.1 DNA cytosine methyltransferase [Dyadobacter fermentans]
MIDTEDNAIPLLSFFTGGGFMDMGFISAGFDVVWTNEVDKMFATLYKEGITNWKKKRRLITRSAECSISNQNSIKDISAETILRESFRGNRPPIFGIIGGPPCQDFSSNGNLDGFKGDRGSLTDAYLYKILELQPAFFVMENVTGLVKVKKNANHFFELLNIMSENYLIDWTTLNSLNFNVPQSRERIFVVGINRNKFDLSSHDSGTYGWFPFHTNKTDINPHKDLEWPAATAFGMAQRKPPKIPLHLCVESCLVPPEKEASTPNADEYFNLLGDRGSLKSIKEGETNRPSFKRLHRYKYSPTACYGNNEVHLHPYQHRRLSVREALRIQGVDDAYVLTTKGQLTKKFKMVGNGVPVPLAEGLAKSLLKFIDTLPVKK